MTGQKLQISKVRKLISMCWCWVRGWHLSRPEIENICRFIVYTKKIHSSWLGLEDFSYRYTIQDTPQARSQQESHEVSTSRRHSNTQIIIHNSINLISNKLLFGVRKRPKMRLKPLSARYHHLKKTFSTLHRNHIRFVWRIRSLEPGQFVQFSRCFLTTTWSTARLLWLPCYALDMEGRAEKKLGALPRLQVAFLCTLGVCRWGERDSTLVCLKLGYTSNILQLTIVNGGKLWSTI